MNAAPIKNEENSHAKSRLMLRTLRAVTSPTISARIPRMQATDAHPPHSARRSMPSRIRPTGSGAFAGVAEAAPACRSGTAEILLVLRDDVRGDRACAADESLLKTRSLLAHLLEHRRRHFDHLHAAFDKTLGARHIGLARHRPKFRLQLRRKVGDRLLMRGGNLLPGVVIDGDDLRAPDVIGAIEIFDELPELAVDTRHR